MIEFKPFTQGMNLLAGDGAKADGALRDASNVVVRTTGEVPHAATPIANPNARSKALIDSAPPCHVQVLPTA